MPATRLHDVKMVDVADRIFGAAFHSAILFWPRSSGVQACELVPESTSLGGVGKHSASLSSFLGTHGVITQLIRPNHQNISCPSMAPLTNTAERCNEMCAARGVDGLENIPRLGSGYKGSPAPVHISGEVSLRLESVLHHKAGKA